MQWSSRDSSEAASPLLGFSLVTPSAVGQQPMQLHEPSPLALPMEQLPAQQLPVQRFEPLQPTPPTRHPSLPSVPCWPLPPALLAAAADAPTEQLREVLTQFVTYLEQAPQVSNFGEQRLTSLTKMAADALALLEPAPVPLKVVATLQWSPTEYLRALPAETGDAQASAPSRSLAVCNSPPRRSSTRVRRRFGSRCGCSRVRARFLPHVAAKGEQPTR